VRNDAALERLADDLGDIARRDVPIGPLTTYRVGGAASVFIEPATVADLERLSGALGGSGVRVLVLGKGSNLLVADVGWHGVCVHLGDAFSEIAIEGFEVTAGAATSYPVLARRSAAAGLSGMEWAVGVPGSVGGAVRMNAGGHGSETRDRLGECRIIDLGTGEDRWWKPADLHLSYRHSGLKEGQIVIGARYGLEQGDPAESSEQINAIVRWRRANQPGGQNAGSVFTNPPGDSAGRLIDAAGMKGVRVGTAMVSTKHANFVQADPSGSADDVRRLVDLVRETVAERLGVELAIELQMVGWDPSPERHDPSCS
jgi:UDP-N-acetylmuramate dehydrogenase